MAGMGSAPNPNRRRRNATIAMTALPKQGRRGRPPKWPLLPDLQTKIKLEMAQDELNALMFADKLTAAQRKKMANLELRVRELEYRIEHVAEAEADLWRQLWATPQAVAWQQLGYTREVAAYTRFKVHAEWGDLDAAKEARQLSDRLGLTPLALLRLRWEIVDVAASRPAPRQQEQQPAPTQPATGGTVTDMTSRRQRLSG